MPWIRRMTAFVTALAALAALATAPEAPKESPGLAHVGEAWQEDRSADPTEARGQKEGADRSGPSERVEPGERSRSGNRGRH